MIAAIAIPVTIFDMLCPRLESLRWLDIRFAMGGIEITATMTGFVPARWRCYGPRFLSAAFSRANS
jgi:hypothetical protein